MKRVTIRDVAKLAGVGIATVSRVLNNKGEVSPTTRRRVLEAAKSLGYIPNSLARSLISGRTKKVGIVITTLLNPFYAAVVTGIESVLASRGYTLALYNSNEDPKKEREAILTLIEQRVDGLILAPVEYESENIKYLIEHQIPFVLVARRVKESNVNFVVADDFKVGKIATEHLLEKGHRKILFLNSWKSSSAKLRLEGYEEALKEAGLSPNEKFIYSLAPNVEVKPILESVLLNRNRPTAIFCFCDSIALEVIKVLKSIGLRIPEDMAVVGCDNLDYTELLDPPLTTIDISRFEMGVKAAKILLELLDSENKNLIQHTFEPKLIIRDST